MSDNHARDLELLDSLLGFEIGDEIHETFSAMRTWVKGGSTRALSSKQRAWAKDVLEKHRPSYENLVSSGKVPNKCSVPTLDILKPENLPKRPPPRKVT